MRTGTLLAIALCAAAVSACGGGGSSAAPSGPPGGGATPAPAPAYTTFPVPNPNGQRMAPLTGDPLFVAVGALGGNDPVVAFASPFLNGILVPGPTVSAFSGSFGGNGFNGGPVTYGRGADGVIYSGDLQPGDQGPPIVRKEGTQQTWTVSPASCPGNFCGPYWPVAIVAGPDGATWVLSLTGLTRLNADGTTTLRPFLKSPIDAADVAVGSDGAFWVAEPGESAVERVPVAGTGTVYPAGGKPTRIAAGSDGALWFIDALGAIGRLTTAGQASSYAGATGSGGFTPGDAIALGGDGAIWFTEANANMLGRLTPGGLLSHYAVPAAGNSPTGIASARDGSLWFLEQNRGGIVVVHATPASASTTVTFTTSR